MKYRVIDKKALVDNGKISVRLPDKNTFVTTNKEVIELLSKSVSVEIIKDPFKRK